MLVVFLVMLSIEMVASTTPSKCSTHDNGQMSASTKTSDGERLIFFTSRQHLYQMKVCFVFAYDELTRPLSHTNRFFPRAKFRTTDNTTVTFMFDLLLREDRLSYIFPSNVYIYSPLHISFLHLNFVRILFFVLAVLLVLVTGV